MKDQTQQTQALDDAVSQTLGDAVGSAEHVVGRRVKALRIARGWSQQELATRMTDEGFSWRQTTVAKTEAADRPIRVNEAANLAVIFGITVSDLLTIPIDDMEIARLTVEMGELRSLARAAHQRVRECERIKVHAEGELSEANAELQRISGRLAVLEEEERLLMEKREEGGDGEQEHQEAPER